MVGVSPYIVAPKIPLSFKVPPVSALINRIDRIVAEIIVVQDIAGYSSACYRDASVAVADRICRKSFIQRTQIDSNITFPDDVSFDSRHTSDERLYRVIYRSVNSASFRFAELGPMYTLNAPGSDSQRPLGV